MLHFIDTFYSTIINQNTQNKGLVKPLVLFHSTSFNFVLSKSVYKFVH